MIYVEYMKDGYGHLNGNTAQIALGILGTTDEPIHLFSGKQHFDLIISKLKQNSVDTSRLIHHEITPIGKLIHDYEYFVFQLNIAKAIFNFAQKNNERKIIFLYTTTFMAYFTILYGFIYKNINILDTLHGNLEKVDLINYVKKSTSNKFLVFLQAFFLGIQNPLRLPIPINLKFLVYNECIQKNLLKKLPKLKNKVIAIIHPFLYRYNVNKPELKNAKYLKLVVPGTTSYSKNGQELIGLLEYLNKFKNIKIEISFAGVILDKKLYDELKKYSFVNQDSVSLEKISIEEKNNRILNAHYALYTYKLNSYKYTASGAALDAIDNETPIITLSNNSINQYFYDYGNIGYILDSAQELYAKISALINSFPQEEYDEQCKNVKNIKSETALHDSVKKYADIFAK